MNERLLKLHTLAKHGVAGERDNAQRLLTKALAKEGLNLAEFERSLLTKQKTLIRFYYSSDAERKLILQCLSVVVEKSIDDW